MDITREEIENIIYGNIVGGNLDGSVDGHQDCIDAILELITNKKLYSVSDYLAQLPKPDYNTVAKFEQSVASFFNAPFAVAVDSCTHGIELCIRMTEARYINVPRRTYLSIPMLADKLGIHLQWSDEQWQDYYRVNGEIYDAAVLWKRNSYIPSSFMCLSFQHQKHLSLGRGGMILCPDKDSYDKLKRMSYDGRLPGIPWREQDVETIGGHYYLTPETAALGLSKLQAAIDTPPRQWVITDWPDISKFKVFNK